MINYFFTSSVILCNLSKLFDMDRASNSDDINMTNTPDSRYPSIDEAFYRLTIETHAIEEGVRALLHTFIKFQASAAQGIPMQANMGSSSYQGLRVREPQRYDGSTKDGRVNDYLRDIIDYIDFFQKRGVWRDEAEKVRIAAGYLTGNIHRLYIVKRELVDKGKSPDFIDFQDYCN